MHAILFVLKSKVMAYTMLAYSCTVGFYDALQF